MKPVILLNVPSSDSSWKSFRQLVEGEKWKSDDHSVMDLTPFLETTRSVVAKDEDGNYLGSVVWNEYDGIAFIGFYLVIKELRGNGIGSQMWNQAINEIKKKNLIIGLRAVEIMLPRYQANGFPFKGPTVSQSIIQWNEISGLCSKNESTKNSIKRIRELNSEEFEMLLKFDKKVTGRNRSDFLKSLAYFGFYSDLPFTEGCVLFDNDHQIMASAGMTPTSLVGSHLFKIAPLYASNLQDALSALELLAMIAGKRDLEARILFHVLAGSAGERELSPVLAKRGIESRVTGTSAFSHDYENPIDTDFVYLPNNNSCHYDA